MMRILICAENIFSAIGGGQSFYGDLIRSHPEHQFWYFSDHPSGESSVPANARVTRTGRSYRNLADHINTAGFYLGEFDLAGKKHDLLYMLDLAASVAGIDFDIVDIPDYLGYATAFPAALKELGVKFEKVAVSLHGTLTDGVTDNWAEIFSPPELAHLRHLEDMLLGSADICYAISARYLAQREAQTGCKGRLLDLTRILSLSRFRALRARAKEADQAEIPASAQPVPAVAFIGRQEKWKGPDLFIDMVADLPRAATSAILMIGPETRMGNVASGHQLSQMARNRSVTFDHRIYAREELWSVLATSRIVGVFPSRRDTLNLAALEAVLTGTPVAISTQAGVCDFLDAAFPGLPFARIDPSDLTAAKATVLDLLRNYDARRTALLAYLDRHEPEPTGESLDSIYAGRGEPLDRPAIYAAFGPVLSHLVRSGVEVVRVRVRSDLNRKLRDMFSEKFGGGELEEFVQLLTHGLDQVSELNRYTAELDALLERQPFLSDEQMEQVWARLQPFCYSINRVPLYRLMARLEKARGNLLLYATYQIRCMRLSGRSEPTVLQEVVEILRDNNFVEEAEAARWIYGPGLDPAAARASLDAMPGRFLSVPEGDIERVLDERTIEQPKVSIIVSMYRAASKLPVFFEGLSRLSEKTRAMTEIVLVDSNSPDDTFEVVQSLLAEHRRQGWDASVYYLRTSVRETIQRAWNRGIAAAKAPYLAFLGVDEMNRTDAFEIMATYLDEHPGTDWVQGTALVTEVNEKGSFLKDVMLYDRNFDFHHMNLFDTCYIGYVGALYRKNIHERVGYYDDRFRGAGDSEFKNRALPLISAVTLPNNLGYFLNYPEERTTASPMAEIEDIRAWYLPRSEAGVGYVLRNCSDYEMQSIFRRTQGYCKSYLTITCTDLELGAAIGDHVERSGHAMKSSLFAQIGAIRWARDTYRVLDTIADLTAQVRGVRFIEEAAEVIERAAFSLSAIKANLEYTGLPSALRFSNDNRSHQHHYLWRSRSQKLMAGLEDQIVELAGPQDFSEALSACGAADQAVDFDRAWAANDLDQLKRLQAETSLDVAVEWSEQDQVGELVRIFTAGAGAGDRHALLVIGARPPVPPPGRRIYFTGPVARPGPALFSARALVVRAAHGNPGVSATRLIRAILSGLPYVADQASVAALAATLSAGVDVSAIEVVDALPSAFERAVVLAEGTEGDDDRAAALHALAEAVGTHPHVVRDTGPSARDGAAPLPAVTLFNLNRRIRERYTDGGPAAAMALGDEADAASGPLLRGVLDALFVSKRAPILMTSQSDFVSINAEPPVTV